MLICTPSFDGTRRISELLKAEAAKRMALCANPGK